MDSKELLTTWNTICDRIKSYENIDVSQINAFFSRLHPQAMSEGFLMLSADNEFIKTWIERHYIDFIKKALLDIYQTPYAVVVEIDTTQKQQSPILEEEPIKQVPDKAPLPVMNNTESPAKINTDKKDVSTILSEISELPKKNLLDDDDIHSPASSLTFENFVIGDSNRLAYSMSVSVAEMPGKTQLNPLFIYGKSGLGKTHLLRAIQNYIYETLPHLRTIYVDSAELLSDYMEASAAHDKEKSSYKNFKNRYEEADVLLIDDVQYLQGKKQTLDIVFQIFNKLTNQGKQVILSADRAPKNIDIDERYQSRFNSGGTFDIQPPEIETKLGIIKSFIEDYCQNEGDNEFKIPDEIQIYIAENSSSNIRELKSAVTKVIYQMTFFNQPNLTLDEVRKLLENHFSGGTSKRLTISDIQKEVEAFYKISHAELTGKKRTQNITYARQIALYLCRQMLEIPYDSIGKSFGRDHSTVMYSVNNVEKKIKENREVKEEIETLMQIIRES
ncbi:MAG: chromosomal replication initiator protein DnaA [Raoultibacter sp.]|jgi:chromosomal replication initiator protein